MKKYFPIREDYLSYKLFHLRYSFDGILVCEQNALLYEIIYNLLIHFLLSLQIFYIVCHLIV